MKCYIDTLCAYREFNTTILIDNTKARWKVFRKAKIEDTHFFIRYREISVSYYLNRYGVGQLWVTFSIGKLLRGSNLFPLDMLDLDKVLYQEVSNILMDIVKLPLSDLDISKWEVSRADLFILHPIEPKQRKWYLAAYKRLSLGSYVPYEYQNTYYLNSVLKRHKAAGTVVRIYPKLKEIQDTSIVPLSVENEFEYYLELHDKLNDYIRIEFQFRRRALRYYFQGQSSVTVADIMQENFQKERINRMIQRLGLHHPIIARERMKKQIEKIFTKGPTRQRAAKYIAMVNGRGAYLATIKNTFTEGQVKYIRQQIFQHDFHTVVTDGLVDLEPVKFL